MTGRFDCDTRIHHGVIHNAAVYLTGQVGTPGTPAEARMAEIPAGIDARLARAGTDRPKSLPVQMWRDDIRAFAAVDRVRDPWMPPEHAPARSSGEGRRAKPGMLVELIVTAAL